MFSQLLKSNIFLEWTAGGCQLLLLILMGNAKKKLINFQPQSLFGKSFLNRFNPVLVPLIIISVIEVFCLVQKDENTNSTLNLTTKDKADILLAIHNSGKKYDPKIGRIVDSIVLQIPEQKENYNVRNYGEPRISTHGIFPKLIDTFKDLHSKNQFELYNAGGTKACNVVVGILYFNKKFEANEKPKITQLAQEIDAYTPLTFYQPVKSNIKVQGNDTIYCIERISYSDSLGRKMSTEYFYYTLMGSFDLNWYGITGSSLRSLKAAQKKYHL